MGELIARRLDEVAADERTAFFAWIEGMTIERDWEDGPAFAAWLRDHSTTLGDATWIFYDATSGALLGTASLVRRDRTLLAPVGGWVLGGVNVVAAARGQGVGKAILRWIDGEGAAPRPCAGQTRARAAPGRQPRCRPPLYQLRIPAAYRNTGRLCC